jgi:hypothetical protein
MGRALTQLHHCTHRGCFNFVDCLGARGMPRKALIVISRAAHQVHFTAAARSQTTTSRAPSPSGSATATLHLTGALRIQQSAAAKVGICFRHPLVNLLCRNACAAAAARTTPPATTQATTASLAVSVQAICPHACQGSSGSGCLERWPWRCTCSLATKSKLAAANVNLQAACTSTTTSA